VERVYRRDGARLQRALFLYAGDMEVARDAAAEAFAQAVHRGAAIRDVPAWIWHVAFRIAAGELKRGRTLSPLPEGSYEPPASTVDLLAALARLSPMQRAAVVLRYYAGYPAKDIARMIGSTAPAVAVHLSRGRRRLRQLLEDPDE
jgi:RNA polymerase sigma-70 factor (ECF subfamily)